MENALLDFGYKDLISKLINFLNCESKLALYLFKKNGHRTKLVRRPYNLNYSTT